MALNLPTFYKRTGSAIVFAIIMLAGLLSTPLAFLALFCLVQVLCLREYFRLMQQIDKEAYWPPLLQWVIQAIGLLIVVPGFFFLEQRTTVTPQRLMQCWGIILVLPVALFLVAAIARRSFIPALMQAIWGLFYIVVPVGSLLLMRHHSYILPVALILMIWTNDTMAYIVGSFIGKTPFSPISPKKTWEGTIGGAILAIAGAGAFGYFAHIYRMIDWMALALCAAVAGTLGDLLESKLKRMADVKDSGAMMPGHGGALDRFDSLIVAAPFACAYVFYFMR